MNLRKLIKYEESLGVDVHQKGYHDSLYRRTTACYRTKFDDNDEEEECVCSVRSSRKVEPETCPIMTNKDKENLENGSKKKKGKKGKKMRNEYCGVLKENKQGKGAVKGSKTTPTKCKETRPSQSGTNMARNSRATEKSSSSMFIRPRSKTPHSNSITRRNATDPVLLYQYYRNEWERFKNCLPGENNRSELRWQIRHKLLGETLNCD